MPTKSAAAVATSLRSALPAVAACAVTLGGLTAWTTLGGAGSPAAVGVTDARLIMPADPGGQTAVVFQLRNTGGADDDLVSVTSPRTGPVRLAHTVVRDGAGSMAMVDAATVPAHGTLTMSPFGLDAMVDAPHGLSLGQLVPFVLHFRDSPPQRIAAVVVRPQDAT
ncbi:copper chaperone PCu(A)C [Streptomyces sp. ICBB 8177]|uniref:copper chaperone PCu(A)C n=1 Tax=Streptomyces sp. ICBB 8177 TaxID=563922 RepID=UPI0013050DE4|nr:copper chaperone PCu(A)C [Streptomyces sp. ICBB 8177]